MMDNVVAKSDPRAALRSAISNRGRAKTVLVRAQQAEERGQQLLAQAESKLSAYGDVDGAILAFRANRLRQAAEADKNAPRSICLPPALVARERARDEARTTAAAAKSALSSLAGDRNKAELVLKKIERKVESLAIEVVSAAGELQAERLRQAWLALWTEFDVLQALSHTWLNYHDVGLKPARLSRDAVNILQVVAAIDHRQFTAAGNPALATGVARWRAWVAALSANANAQFDDDRTETTTKEKAA